MKVHTNSVGRVALAASALLCLHAAADTIAMTGDSGAVWTDAATWSNAEAPSAEHDYTVTEKTLNAPNLTNAATATFAGGNLSITNGGLSLPGSSGGTFTHTYAFTGGELGSADATNPATAIQITDSTLTFSSNNGTTKTFDGRLNFSGDNVINRTGSNYTHALSFNRAIYGSGTLTFNFTNNGANAGRVVNIASGLANSFAGEVILSGASASNGNITNFNLGSSLGAASWHVYNGWRLNNNAANGLDAAEFVYLHSAASRLNLSQPVSNPALDVDLGPGTLVVGNAASTIGHLWGTAATILSGGDDSSLTVVQSVNSLFSGTLGMRAGNSFSLTTDGIAIGEQTIGAVTHNSGDLHLTFDHSTEPIATIAGNYAYTGGTVHIHIVGVPPSGTPLVALACDSRTGANPPVQIHGLGANSRLSAAVGHTPTGITLTFSGNPATLVWTGAADTGEEDGLWDVNFTGNWTLGGVQSNFFELDSVIFDDTATGPATIYIDEPVNAGALTFNNSTLAYSLIGPDGIIGAGSLTKSGSARAEIHTGNTFSGGAALNAGHLAVGSNTALGTGPVTVNGGTLSSAGATGRSLANAFVLETTATFGSGNAEDTGNLTLTGPISGSPGIVKTGAGTLVLSPAAGNTFEGGVAVQSGGVSIGTNTAATGAGPLTISSGGTLSAFPLDGGSGTVTYTFTNSSITVNGGTLALPGNSSGNVTHAYNFTGGELGSEEATDPATAIQIANGTLTLASGNTTTKTFNGRIHWSGNNVVNRTGGSFSHFTNWNRPWYGSGTVTINKSSTGGTAGTWSMAFNGAGSAFSGTVVLNSTTGTSAGDPSFTLNQPVGTASFEVRNRWNLVSNAAGVLDGASTVTLVDGASRLTLTQPVSNPNLHLILGEGSVINAGTGASTVKFLTVNGVAQDPGVYTSTSAFIDGEGSLLVLGDVAPPAGYDDWLTAAGLTPGSPGTSPLESYDGSGVPNLVQFALGGHPVDPADNGVHAVFLKDAANNDNLVLTIAVPAGATFNGSPSPTAETGGIAIAIQGSASLGAWTETVEEIAVQTGGTLTAPAGYQLKSFRLVQTPALGSKGFLRVEVTQP